MIIIYVIDGICDVDYVYLFNVFMLNNDGKNDVLYLCSNFLFQFIEVDFFIYNCWGEEMFCIIDVIIGWDGMYWGE